MECLELLRAIRFVEFAPFVLAQSPGPDNATKPLDLVVVNQQVQVQKHEQTSHPQLVRLECPLGNRRAVAQASFDR